MSKKVLVVDDEPKLVKLIESRLRANGYTVLTAANGEEGLEMARRHLPDLILLDIVMPKMDGKETLLALKDDDTTRAIPVIMLTAKSGSDDVVECLSEGGAADYIVKPYVAGEFLHKINTALDMAHKVPENVVQKEMLDTIENRIKKTLDKGG